MDRLNKIRKIVISFLAILLFIFVVLCVTGCSAVDSIKIGGGYTGEDGTKVEGNVEVVLSKSESDYTGLSVLESLENEKDKYVVLSQKDVAKIVDKIEPEKKSILSISPFKKLAEFLKQKYLS